MLQTPCCSPAAAALAAAAGACFGRSVDVVAAAEAARPKSRDRGRDRETGAATVRPGLGLQERGLDRGARAAAGRRWRTPRALQACGTAPCRCLMRQRLLQNTQVQPGEEQGSISVWYRVLAEPLALRL